jgi:FRG domain
MTASQDDNQKPCNDDAAKLIGDFLRWATVPRARCTLVPRCCYRGHAHKDWKLLPLIVREHQKFGVTMMKQFEEEVIQACRDQFRLHDWIDAEVLAFARHHGAPTRLLDWSSNPLVALWFAVSAPERDASDGVVFNLDLRSDQLIWSAEETCLQDCCKVPIQVFRSTRKIERSGAQQSVFSFTTFSDNHVLKPLEEILSKEESIASFPVPQVHKAELRYILSVANFDPFSLYRDPDSFGASLRAIWDKKAGKKDLSLPSEAAS